LRTKTPLVFLMAAASLLLLVPGPAAQAPPAAEPKPLELKLTDPTGDVSPLPGTPALPYGETGDAVDITEARLYGETGQALRVSVTVKGLAGEANIPATASGGVSIGVCFKIGDKLFGLTQTYLPGARSPPNPHLAIASSCTANAIALGKFTSVSFFLDPVAGRFTFAIPRTKLADLAGAPIEQGQTVTGFFALARDAKKDPAIRYDSAGPGSESITLVYPTANKELTMHPDVNAQPVACGANRDLPTYVIEAGGKRGIPVTLSNKGGGARKVAFSVRTLEGADWKARMMPGIEVPAQDGGNVTVNVIVDTPSGTKHRDCSTLLVRAVDQADPSVVGETSVNVIAAVPASPQRNTFFLHADAMAENACAGSHVWMSVESADAAAAKEREILLNGCEFATAASAANLVLSVSNVAMSFFVDVNPNQDLVVNSSAAGKTATATVVLRSDGAPTTADVTAAIVTARDGALDQLGEQTQRVELGSAATGVRFDIPITFTREQVGTGDPSRTIESTSRLGLAVRYAPRPVDQNVDARVAGRVMLKPEGSSLSLPIWTTLKINSNDPGASGALLGLKAQSNKLEDYANPGKMHVFNFTVRNEGATTDVAVVSASVEGGKAWAVQVVPPGPFKLEAGADQAFSVGVTPPSNAAESEAARIEVVVVSQSDATARSSTTVRLISTAGQEIAAGVLDSGPKKDADKGLLPAPSMMLALVAMLGVVAWMRRR